MKNNWTIWIFLTLLWISCKKEETGPFSDIPHIRLLGISQDTIVQYQDVLVLTIEYEDGNGDLGFIDPDEYAIFVRDARLERFDGFYMGPVTPDGVSVAIKGTVNIEFPSLFVFGNREEESTRFYIKIIDRAGNESNLLETDPVIIKRNP